MSTRKASNDLRSKILSCLCHHDCRWDAGYPFPISCITAYLGNTVSESRIRYQLNKLRQEGLVALKRMKFDDEPDLAFFGYNITEKAKETPEYMTESAKAREFYDDFFKEVLHTGG